MKAKKNITDRLNELKKLGYLVFNFNSNRYLPKGAKGFCDYVIIKKNKIFFVELKLKTTNDRLSSLQEDIKRKIERFGFNYFIVDETNIDKVLETILNS